MDLRKAVPPGPGRNAELEDAEYMTGGAGRRERVRNINRVLGVTLALNLLVALVKVGWGWRFHLLAMVADGFHSLLDGASNIVGFVAVNMAAKPPDADHPYGHRKFESLASLGIALFIFLACYEVFTTAVQRWRGVGLPHITLYSLVVMLVNIAINVLVSRYEYRAGVRLASEFLKADSFHTWSDVYASAAVLVSLAVMRAGYPLFDLLAALFICLLIARTGLRVIGQGLWVLADARKLDPDEVRAALLRIPEVRDVRNVRTRGLADQIFVDLLIFVDPEMPTKKSHEITQKVEKLLLSRFPGVADVMVHVEPDDSTQ